MTKKDIQRLRHYDWLVQTPSPYYSQGGFVSPTYFQAEELSTYLPTQFQVSQTTWKLLETSVQFFLQKHKDKGAVFSEFSILELEGINRKWAFLDKKFMGVDAVRALEYLRGLMTNKKNKIIFIYVTIQPGHANLMIIDKVRKIVEVFDPHGQLSTSTVVDDLIKKILICNPKTLDSCFIPQKFRVMEISDSCPLYGFQIFESFAGELNLSTDIAGYCLFWTMFLLDLRIGNLHMGTKDVQEYFIQKYGTIAGSVEELSKRFRNFIRRYAQYWAGVFMDYE